ncbi:MAG: hypothetical protein V1690_02770 [Candidatus Moraniibacteriota bacterium]
MVISTALGHSGRGLFPYYFLSSHRKIVQLAKEMGITIFTKSSTRNDRVGNFVKYNPLTYKYVQRIPGTRTGMLNSYGLTNPGVVACAQEIRESCEMDLDAIPNFYPEFDKGADLAIGETLQAIEIFSEILGSFFWALELNYSCPNSKEKIALNSRQALECSRKVRRKFPLLFQIAKISIVHRYDFVEELSIIVDAIHSMNTIPYELTYDAVSNPSPLADVGGGGVSGGPAKEKAFAYNKGLAKRVKVPLILGCGVETLNDVGSYQDIGASVVSVCSAVIRTPKETEKIITVMNG